MNHDELERATRDVEEAIKRLQDRKEEAEASYYRLLLEGRGRAQIWFSPKEKLWYASLLDDRRRVIESRADITVASALRQLAREVGV